MSRLMRPRRLRRVLTGDGQVDGDVEASQRRAQLVRDVLQQPALGRQQGLDPAGHLVERPRQLADLVLPRRVDPRRQIAPAEPVHRLAEAPQRGGQVHGQDRAHQGDDQHDRAVVGQDIRRLEPRLDDRDEPITRCRAAEPTRTMRPSASRRDPAGRAPLQQVGPIRAADQVAAAVIGQEMCSPGR